MTLLEQKVNELPAGDEQSVIFLKHQNSFKISNEPSLFYVREAVSDFVG